MHCEATSEKQSMGYFVDGRVSLVVGTHTHCPTADHRIMPGRTAFVSDVGMTGDFESVIGMNKDEPLNRFLRKIPALEIRAGVGARHIMRAGGGNRRLDWPCGARRRGAARRGAGAGAARVLGLEAAESNSQALDFVARPLSPEIKFIFVRPGRI